MTFSLHLAGVVMSSHIAHAQLSTYNSPFPIYLPLAIPKLLYTVCPSRIVQRHPTALLVTSHQSRKQRMNLAKMSL